MEPHVIHWQAMQYYIDYHKWYIADNERDIA